jgi:hypothetical protein
MSEIPAPQSVLEDVKRSFGFLFDRGYKIVSSQTGSDADANGWVVVFQKQDFFFRIEKERNMLFYYFRSSTFSNYKDINGVLYLLSDKKKLFVFSHSLYGLRGYARLMRRDIDKIELCFSEYSKHAKDLEAAWENYNKASIYSFKSLLYFLGFCGILYFVYENISSDLTL